MTTIRKLDELISGKQGGETVALNGHSLPVEALKNLIDEGYLQIKPYPEEGTFSLWGKTATACLTVEEITEKAKSK